MQTLTLVAGDLRLDLRPDLGGAVTRFDHSDLPIFRPTPAGAPPGPGGAAFAMAPYPNRIGEGRFTFDGVEVRLPADPDGAPHALHGEAWRAVWSVAAHTDCMVELVAPPARAWPWRFELRQRLELSGDGLFLTLTLRNDDTRDMPAGLGWHPAFARRAQAKLRLVAEGYLPTGADQLPLDAVPMPARWTFATGLAGAAVAPIDHCLLGWTGHAHIEWPELVAKLSAPACAFLQAYAPVDGDFICLEPQTCAPNAVNRGAAFGLQRLEPGQSLTLRIQIDVTRR